MVTKQLLRPIWGELIECRRNGSQWRSGRLKNIRTKLSKVNVVSGIRVLCACSSGNNIESYVMRSRYMFARGTFRYQTGRASWVQWEFIELTKNAYAIIIDNKACMCNRKFAFFLKEWCSSVIFVRPKITIISDALSSFSFTAAHSANVYVHCREDLGTFSGENGRVIGDFFKYILMELCPANQAVLNH